MSADHPHARHDMDEDLDAASAVLPVPPPPASPPPGEPQPLDADYKRGPRMSTATVTEKGKPCPQCGSERHKKKPITCPFKLWTEDFPVVPRLEKEPIRDAQRRIWENVRVHFVDNDQYVKKDGWTYLGPPGGASSTSAASHHQPHSPSKPIIERVTPKVPLPKEEDEDHVKSSKPCPECGVERHKKKPVTCPFKLWTEDHPIVPRMDKETIRDAHQRIWPQVKQHFIENGTYVNKPGYSYLGPSPAGAAADYGAGASALENPGPPPPPSPPRSSSKSTKQKAKSTGDDESKLFPKSCPECGLERHKKKPITCAFKLWTIDFPDVPQLPNERPRDAHHRIWEEVKHHFLENDQYVKKEGWSYKGPVTGDSADEHVPKSKTPKRNRDNDEGSPSKRSKSEEDKVPKMCPECGAERHRKRPATCAFKLWTEDFPSVPRLGREHIRDAQRRIWETVRERFMEGDVYVKRDGWTYTGPGVQRD